MPAPNLHVTIRETEESVDRLIRYRADSIALVPMFQHLVSELVLLRLSAVMESAIDELACKLVAGATYTNGNHPVRLQTAGSIAKAKLIILVSRKGNRGRYLAWARASDIGDNLWKVLGNTEPIITYAKVHATLLDEIRKVRNYVAHNSVDSRNGFQKVIRTKYGANASVSAGAFLTSTQRWRTARSDDYLAGAKVIVADLSRG